VPTWPEEFTRYLPVFEEQQPLRRPRDDRGRDGHLGVPEHLVRVPEAKPRPIRSTIVPIDVREIVALPHHRADQRIDDVDGDVVIGKVPTIEKPPPEVHDPDRVGLRRRSQWPFPDADPIGVCRQPEIGKEAPDLGVLLTDASVCHRGDRRRTCAREPTRRCSAPPRRRRPLRGSPLCPASGGCRRMRRPSRRAGHGPSRPIEPASLRTDPREFAASPGAICRREADAAWWRSRSVRG
jgi:hypothetical protein